MKATSAIIDDLRKFCKEQSNSVYIFDNITITCEPELAITYSSPSTAAVFFDIIIDAFNRDEHKDKVFTDLMLGIEYEADLVRYTVTRINSSRNQTLNANTRHAVYFNTKLKMDKDNEALARHTIDKFNEYLIRRYCNIDCSSLTKLARELYHLRSIKK